MYTKEREVDHRRKGRRPALDVDHEGATYFPQAGANLQETLAVGTQDLASPHIHLAERTADMTCI